jgi:hypothetical protein
MTSGRAGEKGDVEAPSDTLFGLPEMNVSLSQVNER